MSVRCYPYTFKVSIFSDGKYYTDTGIGLCTGYGNAAEILEHRYGEELVSINRLCLFEEDTVISVPEETLILYENSQDMCEDFLVELEVENE